jgi:hypothetical protein
VRARQLLDNLTDPQRNYVETAADETALQHKPHVCFKNTDCQQSCIGTNCQANDLSYTCNFKPGNYNKFASYSTRLMETLIACRSEHGYGVCQQHECQSKTIY